MAYWITDGDLHHKCSNCEQNTRGVTTMSNKLYEEIIFCADNYDNESEMWNDIKDALRILTRNNCICVLRYDDCKVWVLEYGHDENFEAFGGPVLRWIQPED